MAGNKFLTPANIRLFLLDRTADDNFLLDDVDFQNDLLDMAQILTFDRYETTDPFIGVDFTIENFPFRLELLLGVTGFLLKSKGLNLKRNQLNYTSAAGTAVDDKSTAEAYLAMADKFLAEFDSRVHKIKGNININQGYGAQGSPYENLGLYW